jgi:hypothetical protein
MASSGCRVVYRVLDVVKVRVAGEAAYRFRLTLEVLPRSDVPDGVPVHAWRWAQPAAVAPEVPEHQEALSPPRSAPARPQRRPRPETDGGADLGPDLRRRTIRERSGQLLREPDVAVDDQAADPRHPNRRLRRAYRVDPLKALRRAGTIGPRENDAADELRLHLERVAPAMGSGMGGMVVFVAPWLRDPITDVHLRASGKLRQAAAKLGDAWRPVLWVCLGGTVRGYAAHWRLGTHTASEHVKNGMTRLAAHFYGAR